MKKIIKEGSCQIDMEAFEENDKIKIRIKTKGDCSKLINSKDFKNMGEI